MTRTSKLRMSGVLKTLLLAMTAAACTSSNDSMQPAGGDAGVPGDKSDSGTSTDPDSGPPMAANDKNGVAYLPIPGYTYMSERFDWTENFKSNGSMRHDFEGAADSNQCVVGYFLLDSEGPDDEEISAKLASGPHNDQNPEYADTYDVAITNFKGTRARLRYEATHPDYDAGPTNTISIGDIRSKWIGAMGCKLNYDADADGTPDTAKILAWVDTGGLDADEKPTNMWVNTLDLTIPFSEVELKTPATPYVATIGHPELAQATIRIDEQDEDTYQYKFIAYRNLEAE